MITATHPLELAPGDRKEFYRPEKDQALTPSPFDKEKGELKPLFQTAFPPEYAQRKRNEIDADERAVTILLRAPIQNCILGRNRAKWALVAKFPEKFWCSRIDVLPNSVSNTCDD